jgi:RecB family endonuclease NucS
MILEKYPSNEKALEILNDGINKKHACIISAHCTARYSGRAESYLEEGDRIIFIKPDTTILIHQNTGSQPVNWMPNNTVHRAELEGDKLILTSARISPPEKLVIELRKIHFINTLEMDDNKKLQSQGSEKDMSDMIYANPHLISKDFKPISREEQTKYGFIDVFGHDKGILTIIECKRYNADLGAVTQLRRYVEKMKKDKGLEKVKGIIAAPKISANALKMLQDWGFEYRKIEPPKYFEERKKKQATLKSF